MSEPNKNRPLLDYKKSSQPAHSLGCLIALIIFLVPLGALDVICTYGMLSSHSKGATIAGIVLLIGTAAILYFAARVRIRKSAVDALAVLAICLFLLLIGTCGALGISGN